MLIHVTPGQRLFVDVEGLALVPDGSAMREKPTLILLHGGPGFDHSSFKPLFSQLADVAQIFYVDHRGHGRSDRCPPEQWTLDVFADDVVRLCDALGIVKPIVLGQSFGGFVAQRYLARHPAHPSKVVLSSTSHHGRLERKLAMFEQLGGPDARKAARMFWTTPNATTWAHYRAVCLALYNRTPPSDSLAAGRTRFNDEILFAFVGGEKNTMDLLPGLKTVQCPVLVMAGRMDPVCPLADAEEIAAAIPAPWGRLVVFERSGHGAWRDEPEAAMAVLRSFITDERTIADPRTAVSDSREGRAAPPPRNRFSVGKLLSSKWTAVDPRDREKHFIVVRLIEPESPNARIDQVEIEAVHSRRTWVIARQDLKDATRWRQGWVD